MVGSSVIGILHLHFVLKILNLFCIFMSFFISLWKYIEMRKNETCKNRQDIKKEYRTSTSIRHFEQCNQQLSNLICQNCDGSIKILLDVGNQQYSV